jgi:hypothetical protein
MLSAVETIREYYRAFSTLDLHAIASYFAEPSMTISTQGGIRSAAHRAALAEALGPLVQSLKAKGYSRSDFAQPDVIMLGETKALVRGVAVRYAVSGNELERVPLSYVMHRGEAGWKIAVLIAEN